MGTIVYQYKDPYKPISIMECHKGFDHSSIAQMLHIFSDSIMFGPPQKGHVISWKVNKVDIRQEFG